MKKKKKKLNFINNIIIYKIIIKNKNKFRIKYIFLIYAYNKKYIFSVAMPSDTAILDIH